MWMLIIRGLTGGLFQLALFAALLLIPAGTWNWPRAVQFLLAYGVVLFASTIWLAVAAPDSLEARLEPAVSKKQPRADRIATALIVLAFVGWFVFIPLDVFRFQLLPTPSLGASVFGAALGAAGFAVLLVAVYQNSFAVPVVRDQTERGHTLVDQGLYARVRHPFYTGVLLWFAGLALWLESYAALIAVVVVLFSLIVRIRVEEKTLHETLPGYTDYAARVRYRLVPRVW